jgi:hypothetical protein
MGPRQGRRTPHLPKRVGEMCRYLWSMIDASAGIPHQSMAGGTIQGPLRNIKSG